MIRTLCTLMLLGLLAGLTPSHVAQGAEPSPIPLWADGAPGALGTDPSDIPEIRIYPADPKNATGACVVVLPGGGYGHLAKDHEGHQIAQWFNSIGVTAAVVSYRLGPKYHHPAPMQDAQRAIRYMRAHADEYKIDPHRIGVMGFSAGGHLASTVSTHFDAGDKDSKDPIAQQSSRPDFSILCYPVISLKESFTHGGSRRNLLGDNPDPKLLENLSNETQITKETPPTFLFHTNEDTGVPAENSVAYYLALRKNGVPAELHIYQKGPHGVGLAPKNPVLSTWKERLADWLKVNGFLTPAKREAVSGTIQINEEPIRWGSILFTPENPLAPPAYALISRGQFSLTPTSGPVQGKNAVSVIVLGDLLLNSPMQDYEEVSPRDLVVNIEPGKNVFNFDFHRN